MPPMASRATRVRLACWRTRGRCERCSKGRKLPIPVNVANVTYGGKERLGHRLGHLWWWWWWVVVMVVVVGALILRADR